MNKKPLRFFDAFSGVGGFKIALENVGFKGIGFCDNDKYATQLYKGYEMIAVERLNGINNKSGADGRKNKMFKELLIANYPIKELFKNG